MIDSSVSFSLTVGFSRLASTDSPRKKLPRITPITISVVAALCDSGFLNAGTPFEIASMPVRATAPDEKARRNAMAVMPVSRSPLSVSSFSSSVLGGSASMLPVQYRINPMPISPMIMIM